MSLITKGHAHFNKVMKTHGSISATYSRENEEDVALEFTPGKVEGYQNVDTVDGMMKQATKEDRQTGGFDASAIAGWATKHPLVGDTLSFSISAPESTEEAPVTITETWKVYARDGKRCYEETPGRIRFRVHLERRKQVRS